MVEGRNSEAKSSSLTCVLLVEDDPDLAELHAIWLREAGQSVSVIDDPARALSLAPVLQPAVAVIDIGLPGIDGIELVTRLRGLPELARCRFLAVSAYADARLPARCLAAGFSEFFQKPVPRQALVASVAIATPSAANVRSF